MSEQTSNGGTLRRNKVVLGATAGLLLTGLAAVGVYTVVSGNTPSAAAADAPAVTPGMPVAMTAAELQAFAGSHAGPEYWAGPQDDVTYEVTTHPDGTVYIRYLTGGAEIGSDSSDYLTVATYPQSGAYDLMQEVGAEDGTTTQTTDSGALVLHHDENPTSSYFSFPGADFQVEVYSPETGRAEEMVLDGTVAPL